MENKFIFFAWTTTPWTLPSNLCLAVGEELDYAYVDAGESVYIACKNTLGNYKKVLVKACGFKRM